MKLIKTISCLSTCITCFCSVLPFGQVIKLSGQNLEPILVSMSIEALDKKDVVRVVKDSTIKLANATTFVRVKDFDFKDWSIEVRVLSRLLPDAPTTARGFIGIAFRINDENSKSAV